MLPEVGEAGQEKLKKSKVLVIGAGGLGAPVLQYLTAAGVGTIAIMDDGTVDENNLHRQILYGAHDLGKLKTIISRQKLNSLNPLVNHELLNIHLKPDNALRIIPDFDIIVDATDNISSSYLINDACILTGKPWIFGALKKFEGLITSFNLDQGPSLRCVFPSASEKHIQHPSATGLFGVLPGIIGSFQAVEVIKIITGIGNPLNGKLLIYNMLSHIIETQVFNRNPENFLLKKLRSDY